MILWGRATELATLTDQAPWAADGNDKAGRSLSNPFPERICLGMRLTAQLDMT